jgi:CRP-like cAMP-binding protein
VSLLKQKIRSSLLQFYPFSEEQINIFCQKIVVRNLSKHALLLQHGHVCDFTAIVVHGSLRLYTKSRQNKSEQTLHFFTETDWITEYDCFVSQKPTANFIKALENTEIAVISFSDIHSSCLAGSCSNGQSAPLMRATFSINLPMNGIKNYRYCIRIGSFGFPKNISPPTWE